MNKHQSLNTLVDAETLAQVEALALRQGISSDAYAADAIRRVAADETEFWTSVQKGIDDLDAGRSITHEEFVARLAQRRRRSEAA